jgi:DNA-binding transcriptional LysR family regulator
MDLSELADFHLVAAHGGFRRASLASGRPKATLSRRVAELEADLGVRLFERGSRSLRLTEEGRALQSQTQGPLSDIAEASETIRGGLSGPRGRLRINVPVLFGTIAMGRLAAAFAAAYPQVRIEVTTEDRFVDPVEEGYDVVIRVNPHTNDQLVGRCFLKDHWLLVAPASLPRPTHNDRGGELRVPAVVRIGEPGLWKILDGDRQLTFLPDPVLRFSPWRWCAMRSSQGRERGCCRLIWRPKAWPMAVSRAGERWSIIKWRSGFSTPRRSWSAVRSTPSYSF